ncbi:uncharacterized protein LOC108913319 isoform X3 [Anoplophora glabripennis]|nr:uncharacterized protein LOC108913319 isoform X3 [Anoplophora glabripennis]
MFSQEVEARRKILRGRKTLTRTYMRTSAIPGWVVALLIGIAQMVFGGMLYVLLKVCILDKPIQARYQQVERAEA